MDNTHEKNNSILCVSRVKISSGYPVVSQVQYQVVVCKPACSAPEQQFDKRITLSEHSVSIEKSFQLKPNRLTKLCFDEAMLRVDLFEEVVSFLNCDTEVYPLDEIQTVIIENAVQKILDEAISDYIYRKELIS